MVASRHLALGQNCYPYIRMIYYSVFAIGKTTWLVTFILKVVLGWVIYFAKIFAACRHSYIGIKVVTKYVTLLSRCNATCNAFVTLRKLRATRKLGEMLRGMDKLHGARPADNTGLHDVTPLPLEDLGISKIQSHRNGYMMLPLAG